MLRRTGDGRNGQSRRSNDVPGASAQPQRTDLSASEARFRLGAMPVVAPNGAVNLPPVSLLDTLGSIEPSLPPSSEAQIDNAQEPPGHDHPRTSSSACTRSLE